MSEKDLIIELLGIAEVSEDGKVDFSERAREIIKDLAEKYRQSYIYKESEKEKPEWVDTATAGEIYLQMCERIVSAPITALMLAAPKILLPILWDKLQAEESARAAGAEENAEG